MGLLLSVSSEPPLVLRAMLLLLLVAEALTAAGAAGLAGVLTGGRTASLLKSGAGSALRLTFSEGRRGSWSMRTTTVGIMYLGRHTAQHAQQNSTERVIACMSEVVCRQTPGAHVVIHQAHPDPVAVLAAALACLPTNNCLS